MESKCYSARPPTRNLREKTSGLIKPTFSEEPLTFSTKKDKKGFRVPPPRPPAKTCPPISRIWRHNSGGNSTNKRRNDLLGAQSVTFLDSPDGSCTGTPLPSNNIYDKTKKLSYFEQAFTVVAKIGAGFFGSVYKVISKQDGREYAVKIAREIYRGSTDRCTKLEEVRKHQFLLPHSNCVHFYQSWEERGRLYQQFELCEMSLQEFSEENHHISESIIWSYLVDLLLAVRHLHDHDLIHMDIKPENIFIGKDGICKLGDFGIVIDLAKGDLSSAIEGDPKYLAAEILDRHFSKAADIFALGVTMLELSCDIDLPKYGDLWHMLRNSGPDPNITSRLSPSLRRILSLMMLKDHNRRPTVSQLLELPAIKKARVKRRRELQLNKFKSWLTSALSPFFFVFKFLILCLCRPFLSLASRLKRSQWYITFKSSTTNRTPPSVLHDISSLNTIAYSSDEEDDFSLLSSSTHSSLASPLSIDDSEPPIPIAHSTSPNRFDFSPRLMNSRLFSNRDAQSTPGGLRYRSRFRNTPPSSTGYSPQKRLDFDRCLDSSLTQTQYSDDSDMSLELKPVVLADKFDCFSDSD